LRDSIGACEITASISIGSIDLPAAMCLSAVSKTGIRRAEGAVCDDNDGDATAMAEILFAARIVLAGRPDFFESQVRFEDFDTDESLEMAEAESSKTESVFDREEDLRDVEGGAG
jgi:hypothetical protein